MRLMLQKIDLAHSHCAGVADLKTFSFVNGKLLLFLTVPPGFALVGALIAAPKEKSQTSPEISFYTPLSEPGGEDGPTQVVLLSYANEVTDAAERPGEPMELEGTVRDALWEGPPRAPMGLRARRRNTHCPRRTGCPASS